MHRRSQSRRAGIFHVHSDFSRDGAISLDELRRECIGEKIEFMIMTDHAEDVLPDRAAEYISECERISGPEFLAVPGLEFRLPTDRNVHLLVTGWQHYLAGGGSDEVLDRVLKARRRELVILAHPRKCRYDVPSGLWPALNGVETWNAASDSRYLPNLKSIKMYRTIKSGNPGIVGIGGLDLHGMAGFRGIRIQLHYPFLGCKDLVDSIISGDFQTLGPVWKMRSSPDYSRTFMAILYFGRNMVENADTIRRALKAPRQAM